MAEQRKNALVIVDAQNDFMEGGSLAVPGGSAIVPVVNAVREAYAFDLVVLTQDWHPADHVSFASNNEGAEVMTLREINGAPQMMWPDHCVQGSTGAEFHSELQRAADDVVVQKGTHVQHDSYSGFKDNDGVHTTAMEGILRDAGITHLYVCGLATDYCVSFTVLDAVAAGFTVTVILDAVRGISDDGCEAAMASWAEKGVSVASSTDLDAPKKSG